MFCAFDDGVGGRGGDDTGLVSDRFMIQHTVSNFGVGVNTFRSSLSTVSNVSLRKDFHTRGLQDKNMGIAWDLNGCCEAEESLFLGLVRPTDGWN